MLLLFEGVNRALMITVPERTRESAEGSGEMENQRMELASTSSWIVACFDVNWMLQY